MTTPNHSLTAQPGSEVCLPCPFCGGEAVMTPYNGNYSREDYCVHCRQCDLSLDGDPTPEKAIARWNKRAPASQSPAGSDTASAIDGVGLVEALYQRAKFAREEGNGTALGDAWHFETAAKVIENLRASVEGLKSAAEVLLKEAEGFSVSGVYFSEEGMGHKGPDLVRAAIAALSSTISEATNEQ